MGCAWRNEAVLSWRLSVAAVASVVAAEAAAAAAVAFAADAADAAAVEHTSHMTEARMMAEKPLPSTLHAALHRLHHFWASVLDIR